MTDRRELIALSAASAFAVMMPLLLLYPWSTPEVTTTRSAARPLTVSAPLSMAAAYERPLFAPPAAANEEALPADAPQLVGVVGRLGQDAVALVRGAEGATRALRIGESVDGWQLASLAIDAAFFTRGGQRLRVPLPAGDGP